MVVYIRRQKSEDRSQKSDFSVFCRLSSILLLISVFCLLPDLAYAWGPATHLDLSLTVLANLSWALPGISALLRKYPDEFIYGSVSPDIIMGKKYAGYMYHCHNWSVGSLILNEAETDAQRAAAYGYLTHLAADSVAHNYFVPYKMIRSYSTRSLSHTYWEVRFDLDVPEEIWKVVPKVIQHDYHEFDYLLERVLKKTLFSFRTNKKIFNSILILQKLKQLRRTLKIYAKASRWVLSEKDRENYRRLALESVRDFLENGERAKCCLVDPAGLRKITYAVNLRRRLKSLVRKKVITVAQAETLVCRVKEGLQKSIFDSEGVLPDVQDIL